MIIRKATLGLHPVYMSLYMSLYVKRTTDGGNCLIAWFGALALGIVHVLFPFPCSDPFQARPTLSSRKGFVMQLTYNSCWLGVGSAGTSNAASAAATSNFLI